LYACDRNLPRLIGHKNLVVNGTKAMRRPPTSLTGLKIVMVMARYGFLMNPCRKATTIDASSRKLQVDQYANFGPYIVRMMEKLNLTARHLSRRMMIDVNP
jgi:hypothetical protein